MNAHSQKPIRSALTCEPAWTCCGKRIADAREASVDLWDFALEIDKLYATGLTVSDLRWLVAKKFVDHGRESSVYGARIRGSIPCRLCLRQSNLCGAHAQSAPLSPAYS